MLIDVKDFHVGLTPILITSVSPLSLSLSLSSVPETSEGPAAHLDASHHGPLWIPVPERGPCTPPAQRRGKMRMRPPLQPPWVNTGLPSIFLQKRGTGLLYGTVWWNTGLEVSKIVVGLFFCLVFISFFLTKIKMRWRKRWSLLDRDSITFSFCLH